MTSTGAALALAALAAVAVPQVEPPEAVVFDTSPRLTSSDCLRIQRIVQFACRTWLTERDRHRLLMGLAEEWLRCDAAARAQILEFAASAPALDLLTEANREAVRDEISAALRRAAQAGGPLGDAIAVVAGDSAALLRRDSPQVTEQDGWAWVEMQEWALTGALGVPVSLPLELASEAMQAAAKQRGSDAAGAAAVWAQLRAAAARSRPESYGQLRDSVARTLDVSARMPITSHLHPTGLYSLALPDGYALAANGPAGAETFIHGGGRRAVSVAASAVAREVADGSSPLSDSVTRALRQDPGYRELAPRASRRCLGASALASKEGRWLLLAQLRAPGDSALVSIAATCPADERRDALAELAVVLGAFAFRDELWQANATWAAGLGLARGAETPISAAQRDVRAALTEALGLFAFTAVGAPIGSGGVSAQAALAALGGAPPLTLLDAVPAPAPWPPRTATVL